ncbi:hypothetical protein Tco_0789748 [Tanacetum coccineum]
MLLRIVTMWVPLPKDILGASSQRYTECLFPNTYWVPLPKDLLDDDDDDDGVAAAVSGGTGGGSASEGEWVWGLDRSGDGE